MSDFKFGESKLCCKYLFSKDLLDIANTNGIKLYRQVQYYEIDENLVEFVCRFVIYDWSNVYSVKGNPIKFNRKYLYQVFEQNPEMFIDLLKHCSKIDNFKMVA